MGQMSSHFSPTVVLSLQRFQMKILKQVTSIGWNSWILLFLANFIQTGENSAFLGGLFSALDWYTFYALVHVHAMQQDDVCGIPSEWSVVAGWCVLNRLWTTTKLLWHRVISYIRPCLHRQDTSLFEQFLGAVGLFMGCVITVKEHHQAYILLGNTGRVFVLHPAGIREQTTPLLFRLDPAPLCPWTKCLKAHPLRSWWLM